MVLVSKKKTHGYSREASFKLIHPQKKIRPCARVHACSTNLGFSVTSANVIRPNHGIPLPAYIHIVFENTHTHIATAASETEGLAAVSCMESHMIRRPLGSIDPNSIRETELHTESSRHNRGERESLHRPQLHRERDAARQRAAATRRSETDEAGRKVRVS